MTDLRESFYLTFSPDSKTIAALRGPEIGKLKLVLIDIASGSERVVASGFFSGFSFSPEGDELVFARANNDDFPAPSDLYRVSTSGGTATRLTQDHASLDPLRARTTRSSSSGSSVQRSASTGRRTSSS